MYLSVRRPACLSVCPSIFLSIYLSTYDRCMGKHWQRARNPRSLRTPRLSSRAFTKKPNSVKLKPSAQRSLRSGPGCPKCCSPRLNCRVSIQCRFNNCTHVTSLSTLDIISSSCDSDGQLRAADRCLGGPFCRVCL